LNRLDADIDEVDLSAPRSLRSGSERVPDAGSVMVALSDICLFLFADLYSDMNLNSLDPTSVNPSQYKDYFLVPASLNGFWILSATVNFERVWWLAATANSLVWTLWSPFLLWSTILSIVVSL
jgi:hypothetical protein